MTDVRAIDAGRATSLVERLFATSIVPALTEYIRIPNQSPAFDPDWERAGHMRRAMDLIVAWCRAQQIAGMRLDVVQLPGRTPLLFIEVPGQVDDTVLLYGHMDKQPAMTGWGEGLGPWQPIVRGDRLYGRGGADDGYSTFASLAALKILQDQGIPHARCVVIIEACEESGSGDLLHYVEHLRARIGTPSLVVCLDSGAADYERLWCTTSLRGMVIGNLHVGVLREGVHSGEASGIVPSSFRIVRMLLSRLEDEATGEILPRWLYSDVPEQRVAQARAMASALGHAVWNHYPWLPGTQPVTQDPVQMILNRTWRPQLAITGASGLPELGSAGNVLRPGTAVRVSVRLPPGVNADQSRDRLVELLTRDPPYGADVRFEQAEANDGWNAPPLARWLETALADSSQTYFGAPAGYMGEGGTIPFMAMLGERFPAAQFLITGVLGPESNAHGPNEFLHLPTARRLTCCVAETLRRHALRND
ncbi:MAG TPA: M20 family metallopeptidase [Gammaproteobacteria bacterium]|nr:M20 family metallopeptidase [Gammaproteobacteria bacterium]